MCLLSNVVIADVKKSPFGIIPGQATRTSTTRTAFMTPPAGTAAATRLNPSLTVEAVFAADIDGEQFRSKVRLSDHPEIATWLLSLLDCLLIQQGRLPGEPRIAVPQGTEAVQLLIDARILSPQPQPDGLMGLQLAQNFDVKLLMLARRRGLPARSTLLPFLDDADLTRWLLSRCARPAAAPAPASDALAEKLAAHDILVSELPPPDAWFPDPAEPVDLAAELTSAALVIGQPAGAPLPTEVRNILGRHVPALPPDTALLWGQDAGTGMMYPTVWSGATAADVERVAGTGAVARAAQWDRQRAAARESLRTRRYAELRGILPDAQRAKLRRYFRQLVERGYFPSLGDGQVELRASLHNQRTAAALHHGLAGIVNSIGDEPVIASYSYLACYEAGAVLARHRDRKQCAYNLSLVLDMQGPAGEPEPWPIYMELDGSPQAVLLQVGDGLCYSGTDIWHWRDALPAGHRAVICFYHFVPVGFTGSLD